MANSKETSTSNRGQNTATKVIIIIILIAAVSLAVYLKKRNGQENTFPDTNAKGIPQLVDLGAGKCIPCQMMAPILAELKTEYSGAFETTIIDVGEERWAIDKYNVRLIPTQVFFDASGKELFRHQGFFSRDDILNKWKELGIDIETIRQDNAKGNENETSN